LSTFVNISKKNSQFHYYGHKYFFSIKNIELRFLQNSGAEINEIASAISKETRLSPELVGYAIKQSA
jgi:hypothetical protein